MPHRSKVKTSKQHCMSCEVAWKLVPIPSFFGGRFWPGK